MIEFAPNPSGPAHLGTLRSYTTAWLEAKRHGVPMFLRFDAHGWPERKWADQLLSELRTLGIEPDVWQFFNEEMKLASLPSWAITQGDTAYYPDEPVKMSIPSYAGTDWKPGDNIPMIEIDIDKFNYLNSFATKQDGIWNLAIHLVKAIHMHLRNVEVIVRSHNVAMMVRQYNELPAARWFGLKLPEMIITSMVVLEDKALSKHCLEQQGFGTIGWAINTFGPDELMRKIHKSIEDKNAPAAISVYDLMEITPDHKEASL